MKNSVKNCILFKNFSDAQTDKALSLYKAEKKLYHKGDLLIRAYGSMERFGIVVKGSVSVYSDDINGNQMMMATVEPSGIFGESLCYLAKKENPVYIIASEQSEVLWLDCAVFRDISGNSEKIVFEMYDNFVASLAHKALKMNDRVQILSKLTIRDKLITYFTHCERMYKSKTFTVPMDRNALSVYLAVNRTALSRELSKMKSEKIIDFYKNSFKLL